LPKDEVQIVVRGAGCEAPHEQCAIAFCDQAARENLRFRCSGRLHLVAPYVISEGRRIHALTPKRQFDPGVESVVDIGLVGNEGRRLQCAGLIGFAQSRQRRQRTIERRRPFGVEPSAIKLRAFS